MSEVAELIEGLHKLAASAAFPPDCRYVGIKGIAVMLNYSESHVKHKITCAPDFPAPARVGDPRWKVSDVVEWMDSRR